MSAPIIPKGVPSSFDKLRNDWDMSRESRFNRRRVGLAPQGGTADYHYRSEQNYYRDIEKARDMDRNDSIVGQCLDRSVANIVQDGFKLDPQTGSKELDLYLWNKWQRWATTPDQCDIAGEFTFRDFEIHACRSMFRDGDCVIIALEDGQLQFLEAHSIQTSTTVEDTVLGITKDQYGKRQKYWFMQDGISPHDAKEVAVPIDVRDSEGRRQLFHVYNPKRTTQTRGVTALAPIFEIAGMLDDIQFAKLVQQQVASCFAIFREQAATTAASQLPGKTSGYGQSSVEVTQAGVRYIENIAPGMEIIGKPGEKLTGFSPDMPSSGYFEQVKLILQTIGVNLGLPLCLVLMDGSETNFSGWRGAVDEARKGFRFHQNNLIARLHRGIYEHKVSQWLEDDAELRTLAGGGDVIDIYAHKWNAPRWSYIDPVGDAQGDELRIKITQTSRRRLHAEHGDEWEEIADEMIADNAYAITNALAKSREINEQFPDAGIQWFHLISLPLPNGVQLTMQDPLSAGATEATDTTGTGEMSQLNRRQFQNNQKAITDLLNAMIDGSMSEARTRVGLSALGLSPANVDLLIEDARDGKVDTV